MTDDLRICGSCHTLIKPTKRLGTVCPRCADPLDPSPQDVLRAFISKGIVEFNRKGGVTLKEAQNAAEAILDDLEIARGSADSDPPSA